MACSVRDLRILVLTGCVVCGNYCLQEFHRGGL